MRSDQMPRPFAPPHSEDVTTPKRNEAVARYAPGWTEGSDNIYMHEVPNGNYVRHCDYAALQGEVSRLRAALEELICACDPMQLAERECERIVEQNERGGTTISTGFPLLKVRHDDLRDFTAGIKRAREALNLEPPTDGC